MRFRTIAAGIAAVVLSTVLVPIAVSAPAQAQTQTEDWFENDWPDLNGDRDSWSWGSAGNG